MNIQHADNTTNRNAVSVASDLSSSAAEQAAKAIGATKRVTDSAAQSVHDGLANLQDKVPDLMTNAGASADAYIAQGVQRAHEASSAVRESAGRAQERAAIYVRQEPFKALAVAAGIGALLALLLSHRSRH